MTQEQRCHWEKGLAPRLKDPIADFTTVFREIIR